MLAARLGFTPDTRARIVRELSDSGLIHVNGKHVTLTEKFVGQQTGKPETELPVPLATRQGGAWFNRSAPGTLAGGHAWN